VQFGKIAGDIERSQRLEKLGGMAVPGQGKVRIRRMAWLGSRTRGEAKNRKE
jgi:hypothetical protein